MEAERDWAHAGLGKGFLGWWCLVWAWKDEDMLTCPERQGKESPCLWALTSGSETWCFLEICYPLPMAFHPLQWQWNSREQIYKFPNIFCLWELFPGLLTVFILPSFSSVLSLEASVFSQIFIFFNLSRVSSISSFCNSPLCNSFHLRR